ncbi:isochorismatase family protein [Streptomyces globisporus]|uniref:Isochorismatase family protein n=1 Tax=Streptomyces globisporus TaxID=1908 RepID=A0A423V2A7_STRGL|nr:MULTISPECIES: isochorismatase family protein [Streptomyces]ROV68752.1 isochorismatase family protein [Streptomyces globisporus]
MAIPPIPPYPLPTEGELPQNRVSWQPSADRAALLVHDMQRYFLAPFDRTGEPAGPLLSNVRALLDTARATGMPVVYTAQPGDMDRAQRGLLYDFWGQGMSSAPKDRELVPEIAPTGDDVVLTKWRYSAFHRTGLLDLMERRGRDQLLVAGVYAHIGCLASAYDAFANDIQPFLIADALGDFGPAEHRQALEHAADRCAAVLTTHHAVQTLRAGSGREVGESALLR